MTPSPLPSRGTHAVERFATDERGAGTVFALFWLILCFVLAGFAVDGTNAWRNQQQLQQTADVAAHAGVVQIARGADNATVHQTSVDAVAYNMPQSVFGPLIYDANSDVVLLDYDDVTNTAKTGGTTNAVGVTLHRDGLVGNAVRTLMLRVAALATRGETDVPAWNMQVTGVAAVVPHRKCSSTDGFYAQGQIHLSSSQSIGAGYCLHSQDEVWMPQQNSFEVGAGLSMPDLDDCGSKCTDEANPGSEAAAFETNLLLPDLGVFIADKVQAFTGPSLVDGEPVTYPVRDAFYDEKMGDASLDATALATLASDTGIDVTGLDVGDVVSLSQSEFMSMTQIPEGLTYSVSCASNGSGGKTEIVLDSSNGGNALRNVAIVTNCAVHFGSDADVSRSLVISTRASSNPTITADSGARAGTLSGQADTCAAANKSYIMAVSPLKVPASFTASNVAFMVDNDINIAASSSASVYEHAGTSFHASGNISISSSHTFTPCNEPPSGLMPQILVIRHVAPIGNALVATN